MTSTDNYYHGQLTYVGLDSTPKVKVKGSLQDTNWMDINQESAPILKEWLTQFEPKQTKGDLERELYSQTDNWVNSRFNFIQKNVYDKMTDNMLFENIRQVEHDKLDFIHDYNLMSELIQYIKVEFDEEVKDIDSHNQESFETEIQSFIDSDTSLQNDVDNWLDQKRDENYPMWNTLFEFKDEPSEETIQKAIDSGFGVIEGMDDFNTTLFVSGCGYSFYAQHWIPLWLRLPYTDNEKYSDTKYDHL